MQKLHFTKCDLNKGGKVHTDALSILGLKTTDLSLVCEKREPTQWPGVSK